MMILGRKGFGRVTAHCAKKLVSFLAVLNVSSFNLIEYSFVFILWKGNQQHVFVSGYAGQGLGLVSHCFKPVEITTKWNMQIKGSG